MRKLLPYLMHGTVLCLSGFAFFYLWRKLSSVNLETFSEASEESLKELKSWQKRVENDLDSQFERIRSIAGRVDRRHRKDTAAQEESAPEPAQLGELDQGALNALLAKRFHGSQG